MSHTSADPTNDLPPFGQPKQEAPDRRIEGMTDNAGCPVASNNDSLTVGPRGPILLQDHQLLEKLAHQNRERIPERTVHAKGWGAYGSLTITKDISKYTCAKVLQKGTETPMLARFSTVAGERGAADLERDVRGFALKFYTEEGNWDLVCNNTPIFFVRDTIKFPDFIHVLKRHPYTNQRSPTALWDFWSLSPESLHQVTYLMGDRGIPKSVRQMNGYGSHTFSLWNREGERFWVKFHFKSQQGVEGYTNEESEKIIGASRDTYGEDLYNAINRGEFPKWTFQIQIMTPQEAEHCPFNPFDVTKVWPHDAYPLIDVGEFILDRLPQNFFAEIEQAAFNPASVVPGIGFSPDKMLQGRLFAYSDTHLYRLGVNYQHIPVNRSRCPLRNYNRDGAHNTYGGIANANPNAFYEPNSFGGPVQQPRTEEPPLPISAAYAARYDHREEDDYAQPRALFEKVFSKDERERVFSNIAGMWRNVPAVICERALSEFKKISDEYEAGVRRAWEKVKAADSYMPNGLTATWETPHVMGKPHVGASTIQVADRG